MGQAGYMYHSCMERKWEGFTGFGGSVEFFQDEGKMGWGLSLIMIQVQYLHDISVTERDWPVPNESSTSLVCIPARGEGTNASFV